MPPRAGAPWMFGAQDTSISGGRKRTVRVKGSPESRVRYLEVSMEARKAAEMFPPGHHRRNLLEWADAYENLARRGEGVAAHRRL